MPSIRKIRIVNFRYDDGSKLIPDEIFSMENEDGKPTDTLLNLDNGGGKTVLVQLMLQTVCPKAKVQNRNIADYFRSGTDHTFVLTEWAPDNSPYSLLTGAALAAGVNAEDENGNRSVRFFTFLHTYPQTGDKSDIVNMPLTEYDGKHFRAISYDELRKLLQSRKIEYFSSEQLRSYQRKLAEDYGILHSEWENILVRVNAVEGGVSKFFEDYKTADRLLDRFIIPGVMPNGGGTDESLEEMFLNYAKSYAGQEENMRLRARITEFTDKLEKILPSVKAMWEHDDARIQAIRALADRVFTLEHEINAETERKNSLQDSVDLLERKLRHIRAEKASAVYYAAKDKSDAAAEELDDITQKRDSAEERRVKYDHLKAVLNAAKEFSDLAGQRNTLAALYSQLRELDSGGGDEHIDSLRFSLFMAAEALRGRTDSEIENRSADLRGYSGELDNIKIKISELTDNFTSEKEKNDKFTGRRDAVLERINCGLEKLALKITVMLDGSYSADEIKNIRADFEDRLKRTSDILGDLEEEERQLSEEYIGQNERRGEIAVRQAELTVQLGGCEKSLNEYHERYDAAVKVIEHLSLAQESIFTDEPIKSLDSITAELHDKLRRTERSEELLSEQLACIGNGQLHLTGAAVGFLRESGIPFRTGEKYLLLQPPEIRQTILGCDPSAAYAVIVDSEKEREALLAQAGETWLSALIPIYTLADIADIADGKRKSGAEFLAAYDKKYFSDAAAYEEKIRAALDDVRTDIENTDLLIGEWNSERAVLSLFTYSPDDEAKMISEINSCREQRMLLRNELERLDKRRCEIRDRSAELKKICSERRDDIHKIRQNCAEFEDICSLISQYEALNKSIAECAENCGRISRSVRCAREEEKITEERLRICRSEIGLLTEKLKEYRSLTEELKDSPEAEIISSDYHVLLAEYRLYREQISADRRSLENRINDAKSAADRIERALKRFGIPPDEYENAVYSESAYNYADEELQNAESEYRQLSELCTRSAAAHAEAESILKQAENRLAELHTELLERSEVGSDHERRISECEDKLRSAVAALDNCKDKLDDLTAEEKYTARYASRFADDTADYTPKISAGGGDADSLRDRIESCTDALKRAEDAAKEHLHRELGAFRSENGLFAATLDGIASVIGNKNIHGDRYFSLYERTEGDIRRYRDRLGQLDIILRDIEDSRKELVSHCLQRAGRLYENLMLLSGKSNVQIGNVKKQMLRIGLPEIDPSSDLPASRINDYIGGQVRKFLAENDESAKSRRSHLEIRRLLNCYIGSESIPITVFKIDKVIRNSRYRSWEDALKANSGGEQFVVFFSLVASVMNYSRGFAESLGRSSGVLILDNPFGPISSPHLLEPMFRIAHHFNIQLICLTHLGTAAVTGCFDMVYQLSFRTPALSDIQILKADAVQHMEHAYYLSEQLSIL